jgi:DNA-binding CsgD family transcriptional regulator
VSALAPRVESLGPAARQALDRLVVLGRPASAEVLGDAIGEVVRSGLAVEVGEQVAVAHPLLGEVLVERLGSDADAVRRELAVVVGGSEAAHQLEAAGDAEAARTLALALAEQAERRERAALLALAVRCAPAADSLDLDRRIEAARLASSTGQLTLARSLCEVPEIDDLPPLERGMLRTVAAEVAWLGARLTECLQLLELALADVRGSRTRYEVLALAGSTLDYADVGMEGRSALDRAQEAYELAVELDAEIAFAQGRLAALLLNAGDPAWGVHYESAIALARAAGDNDLADQLQLGSIFSWWMVGERSQAEAAARRAAASFGAPVVALPPGQLSILANGEMLALLGGAPRSSILDQCRPLLEVPLYRGRALAEAAAAIARADLGDHDGAEAQLVGAAVRAGSDPTLRAAPLWAAVETAWLAGRLDEAHRAAAEVAGLGIEHHFVAYGRLIGGHAAVELGFDLVGTAPTPVFPGWSAVPVEWAALEAAASGSFDVAASLAVDAADLWGDRDRRSEARCRWAAAEWAARAGRPDALQLVELARGAIGAAQMRSLQPRLDRAERRAGGRAVRHTKAGVGVLTGREVEVLELVAAGLRTAEIAATLGVTASTVESFVRSAMRKLDAPTRVAAATRLQQLREVAASGEGSPPA